VQSDTMHSENIALGWEYCC